MMDIPKLIKNRQSRAGFTVVELMIATSVFSVILILSLTGFLQIGQMFYKGVNITNTTSTAKQVITSLKNDVSFDSDTASITKKLSVVTVAGQDIERWWFCAGSNRYSFILGRQVDREAETIEMRGPSPPPIDPSGWSKFGLLKDQVPVTSCPNPFDAGPDQIKPNDVTELIGDKMRLSNLTICQLGLSTPSWPGCPVGTADTTLNKLYTLSVHIAYGDDDVLDVPGGADAKCKSGAANSRYCFVTDIRTTARRGVQP